MGNLILPKKVTIQLLDGYGKPFKISDVIVTIHLFARYKNDIYLSPFVSDNSGKVIFTQRDVDIELEKISGSMDYVRVETCFPFVEIFANQPEEIDIALERREKYWPKLRDEEKARWDSIEDLLNAYRRARNKELKIEKGISRIRDEWNGEKDQYSYNLSVNKK